MARLYWWLAGCLVLGGCFGSCTCGGDEPLSEPAARRIPTPRGGIFANAGPPERDLPPPELPTRSLPTIAPPTIGPAGAVDVPEDFPADVPLFEGAEAFAVQNLAGNARNVLFDFEGEADQVVTFYKDEMATKGWKVEQEYSASGQAFLSFKQGETLVNVTVTTDPRNGRKIVAIMYYDEQPLPFSEF